MKDFTSLQAEVEILGRIILDEKTFFRVNELIKPDDFYLPRNKAVYKAMVACEREGKPIEPGILAEYLKKEGVGVADLMEISSKVASTSHIRHYAEILVENSKKRRFLDVMKRSQERLDNDQFTEVAQWISSELYKIDETSNANNCVDREQLMEQVLNYIQRGIETNGESIGMKTGWKTLDTALTGFKKGDLVVIGARPSVGKTAFVLNLTDKLSANYKVLFLELEMTAVKLGMREVAAKGHIPMSRLFSPHTLTEGELAKVMQAVTTIAAKGNVVFNDKQGSSLEYIRNQIRNQKYSRGVDVVVVDHIGLIPQRKGFSNKNDWLGEVSSTLKALAKEFDVCVIALSQLSRGVEYRTEKKPQLSDLRDSGNIEQDADVVLMLYRAGYYNKDKKPEIEALKILVEKNRDGKTGSLNMAVNLKTQLVTEEYR